MSILVTGGAGYIGSHTVLELIANNEDVVVVDNLENGHKEALPEVPLLVGDIRDKQFLLDVFKKHPIEAVIHFAAYIEAGESVINPLKFYNNNVVLTLSLLDVMKECKVDKIVFSSTAATYGEPKKIPIEENDETLPTNPYGETKLSVEKMLKWCDNAYDIKYCALRYFNACGAHLSGKIGEDHSPETHLIPLVLQTAMGYRDNIKIFGNDYPTPDGTCVRDYIHVSDLAAAHVLALQKLRFDNTSSTYNLGNGKGFSVIDIIDTAKEVTGKKIETVIEKRRLGDPAVLVASSKKAKDELNWNPKFTKLSNIIETAWNWHTNNPKGYKQK
jgi:UDP-glucose 4-epimerase